MWNLPQNGGEVQTFYYASKITTKEENTYKTAKHTIYGLNYGRQGEAKHKSNMNDNKTNARQ